MLVNWWKTSRSCMIQQARLQNEFKWTLACLLSLKTFFGGYPSFFCAYLIIHLFCIQYVQKRLIRNLLQYISCLESCSFLFNGLKVLAVNVVFHVFEMHIWMCGEVVDLLQFFHQLLPIIWLLPNIFDKSMPVAVSVTLQGIRRSTTGDMLQIFSSRVVTSGLFLLSLKHCRHWNLRICRLHISCGKHRLL